MMLYIKASRELQSFQNSELEVCFFQIARAPKANGGLPFSSLSRLNVRYRQEKGMKPIMEDNLKCHILGLDAYRFAANGMKALAHVLQSEGEKVGFHDDVYDWARILFHPEIRGLGATVHLKGVSHPSPNVFAPKLCSDFMRTILFLRA